MDSPPRQAIKAGIRRSAIRRIVRWVFVDIKGGIRRTYESQKHASNMSAEYTYRRKLKPSELLPAIGAGIAAGLAGFYVVQLLIQRTPLVPEGKLRRLSRPPEPNRDPRTEPKQAKGTQVREIRTTSLAATTEVPPPPSAHPMRGR